MAQPPDGTPVLPPTATAGPVSLLCLCPFPGTSEKRPPPCGRKANGVSFAAYSKAGPTANSSRNVHTGSSRKTTRHASPSPFEGAVCPGLSPAPSASSGGRDTTAISPVLGAGTRLFEHLVLDEPTYSQIVHRRFVEHVAEDLPEATLNYRRGKPIRGFDIEKCVEHVGSLHKFTCHRRITQPPGWQPSQLQNQEYAEMSYIR